MLWGLEYEARAGQGGLNWPAWAANPLAPALASKAGQDQQSRIRDNLGGCNTNLVLCHQGRQRLFDQLLLLLLLQHLMVLINCEFSPDPSY